MKKKINALYRRFPSMLDRIISFISVFGGIGWGLMFFFAFAGILGDPKEGWWINKMIAFSLLGLPIHIWGWYLIGRSRCSTCGVLDTMYLGTYYCSLKGDAYHAICPQCSQQEWDERMAIIDSRTDEENDMNDEWDRRMIIHNHQMKLDKE